MFFMRRPSAPAIDRFLDASRSLPLSYGPVGIVRETAKPGHGRIDEDVFTIGRGDDDFERARAALTAWKHFDLGWVETFPRHAGIEVGTMVAVLIRHFGFWSLNGCRVVYPIGCSQTAGRFGFAYGTLTNHAESGEEIFEVFVDPRSGNVMYRIRAISWPQVALTRVGQPIVRMLQARFRRDSAAAIKRAMSSVRCRL
jgi:uncharacterized protein (UPF0548 family)